MDRRWQRGFVVVLLLLTPSLATADAVIRTRAMLASTIAEIFVREDHVVVELEIGGRDLPRFADLLPDELYPRLGNAPEPWPERLGRFLTRGLVLTAGEADTPLAGTLEAIEPRTRVPRDGITGEALPTAGDDEERVVFARLRWEMPGRPPNLTIAAPQLAPTASIGFVAYDRAVAVNDFRYLTPTQTLVFDWEDPWYTAFRTRALRRSYYAPMHGFLYVDPFEVRKEIVFRPRDLQHWVDLGLDGRETIPADMQPEIKRKALAFLREHHPVTIDGRPVEPEFTRIDFLERTLRTSRVIDPPEDLDIYGAIIGAIFIYPTEGLPERAAFTWDLFNERVQRVPGASVDQAGPLPILLEPDFALLEWRNFLTDPVVPTLHEVSAPPAPLLRWLAAIGWTAAVVGLLLLVGAAARRRPTLAVAGLVVVALGAGLVWQGHRVGLSEDRTREIVAALLHNTYHAFDFREEGRIYDVLARSVSGDLLTDIFLETRRGLEIANQGGARAKVKSVELTEHHAEPAGAGFRSTATWDVAGSVGHWGHVHERRNRYTATLDVAPIDDVWRLTGLEILEEERL